MSPRPYRHLLCSLFAAVLSFVPAAAARAVVVKDASGKSVSISDASRIVSVGGAVTEILYAIGLEDRVVAVDTTSLYPQSALNKPKVGYMRQLSPEGVLGLAPTLILASEGSGPKETISVLESASVPFVSVPDHFTGDGIIEKISVVSSAAGAAARGECLSHAVKDDLDALTSLRKGIDRPKRVLFVLSFMNDRPMVAGRATAADGVIKLAGATNAIDGYEGYKLINDESIIAAKPDAILVMQRGPESLTAEAVFANPAFSITPAAKEKAFVSMEGLYLLGFGPRTALAARDLAGALYPELKTDKLPSEAAGQSRAELQVTASVESRPPGGGAWKAATRSPVLVTAALLVILIVVALIAITIGAAGIPFERLMSALGLGAIDPAVIDRDRLVLWSIRLPRIVIACMVGALLAAGGTIMQGLFRNPLAEPGLVGVSSGAALAATTTIVVGDRLLESSGLKLPFELLPVAAFVGALITTALLYRIATREGRTSIATLLLAGIAIGALAQAVIGLLVFIADDRQLRDITFWSLGSLSGSTWGKVLSISPFLVVLLIALPLIARGLDLMVLGETEAFFMGLKVEQLKRYCIVLVAAAAGAAVSVSGVIGFVGIVVPHLLRLVLGPGHRVLLPASACFGAILLLCADTFARMLAAPAELPIGIVTAAIGAPFFLVLLLKQRALVGP